MWVQYYLRFRCPLRVLEHVPVNKEGTTVITLLIIWLLSQMDRIVDSQDKRKIKGYLEPKNISAKQLSS